VRKEGLEPPYPFGYQILSLARLPVPPLSRLIQTITGKGPTGRRGDGATVRSEGPRGLVRGSVFEAPNQRHASRRLSLSRAGIILGFTAFSAARFTFEMINSSTGPRAAARELIARRAGTGLISSNAFCASSVV
jgi:hypothetical protein